jgi:hypothetical protein
VKSGGEWQAGWGTDLEPIDAAIQTNPNPCAAFVMEQGARY